MLTQDEEKFLKIWEERRHQKSKLFGLATGLRLAVTMVLGIFIMLVSGWHKSATMVIRSNTSTILAVMFAAIGIVVFITVFTSRFQREQNEQRYQEIMAKKTALQKKDQNL